MAFDPMRTARIGMQRTMPSRMQNQTPKMPTGQAYPTLPMMSPKPMNQRMDMPVKGLSIGLPGQQMDVQKKNALINKELVNRQLSSQQQNANLANPMKD